MQTHLYLCVHAYVDILLGNFEYRRYSMYESIFCYVEVTIFHTLYVLHSHEPGTFETWSRVLANILWTDLTHRCQGRVHSTRGQEEGPADAMNKGPIEPLILIRTLVITRPLL